MRENKTSKNKSDNSCSRLDNRLDIMDNIYVLLVLYNYDGGMCEFEINKYMEGEEIRDRQIGTLKCTFHIWKKLPVYIRECV